MCEGSALGAGNPTLSQAFFCSLRELLLDMGLEEKAEEAVNVS